MMDNVREWAAAVCCACVIGALLSWVSPDGGGKKLWSTVLSLMILCVMFRPLTEIRTRITELKHFSFDLSENENPVLEREIERNAEELYASYLRQNLCRVLDGDGISYERVEVTTDNSGDGCISIERVEVIVKEEDADTSYRIKELLSDYIGFAPVVTAHTGKGSEEPGNS